MGASKAGRQAGRQAGMHACLHELMLFITSALRACLKMMLITNSAPKAAKSLSVGECES